MGVLHALRLDRDRLGRIPAFLALRAARTFTSPKLLRMVHRPRRDFEAEPTLAQAQSILVLCLHAIGDAVLTTGFLRELRVNAANASITLVTTPECSSIFAECPYIEELVVFPPGKYTSLDRVSRRIRMAKLASGMRAERTFDIGILPSWDGDPYEGTSLLYLASARSRVSYTETTTRDKRVLNKHQDLLLTHALPAGEPRHEVETKLGLIEALGGRIRDTRLELWPTDTDERVAEELFYGVYDAERPCISFGIAGSSGRRQWPVERFINLAERIVGELGARVIIVGGPKDKPRAHLIQQEAGRHVVNAAGKLTIPQSYCLLRHCAMHVGVDSSPIHIASAAGIPVVQISCHPEQGDPAHINSPIRYRPWGVPYSVVRPSTPCSLWHEGCVSGIPHCILKVSVDDVWQAVLTLTSAESRIIQRNTPRQCARERHCMDPYG